MSVMLDTGRARGFPGLIVWFPCACVQHRHKDIAVHISRALDFIACQPRDSPQSCLQQRIVMTMGELNRKFSGLAFQSTEQP